MESKTRLRQRLCRLFRPSAMLPTSCNSTTSGGIFSSSSPANTSSRRSLSTATDNIIAHDPVFFPHNSHFNSTRLHDRSLSFSSSSRLRSLDCSGGCRPTKAASDVIPTTTATTTKAIDSKKKERRVRESGELYATGEREGRTCPPASPTSPSNDYFCNLDKIAEQEAEKKRDKATVNKKKKKKKLLSNPYGFTSSSSGDDNGSELLTSDNADETEAFFSSRSFSSDSSEFYKRPSSRENNKNGKKDKKQSSTTRSSSSSSRRRPPGRRMSFRAVVSVEEEEGEETSGIPVTKRSSDPYVDFRNSMVEMIVERQIFGARDLERLLHSYLSLNSPSHHSVILRAFADISQVVFGH